MRDDWSVTSIGDVAEASWGNTTVTKKQYKESGFTAFSASGPDGFVDWFEHDEKGVVLSAIGALCGKTWLAEGKWTPIKNTIWFKSKSKECLTDYLFLVSKTPDLWPIRGQAQPFISLGDVRLVELSMPPLAEQKRIVDVVSSVDVYIDALQKQVGTARAARKAVLHELLSTSGDDWSECGLGDLAEVLDRMRKPISGAEREKRIGDVPYYGATGQAGWIDKPIFDEELVLLGEDAIDFLNPDVHKAYLISGPSWVNNHAHVLRAKREKVLSFFLMEALNAVDYSKFVAFGTRSKLTQGSMMGISVQVPPLVEQKRIAEIVSSMDEVIQSTEQAVVDAKNLRSGLLSDLLSGEHEIPASYDSLLGAA